MRVLMLATYFPKPGNPLMGTWALEQAQALAQHPDIDLKVVSFTSWVPQWVSRFSAGARAYAECPATHNWQGLEVLYPRWCWYPMRPMKDWEYKRPLPFLRIAWHSAAPFLTKVIAAFKPDIVFAHHSAINGYIAAKIKHHFGIPFVVTDHDFGEIQNCDTLPARRSLFEHITREASCMVSVSRRMELILLRLFPHATTRVVHNGTLEALLPAHANSNTPTTRIIFSCGAFYERKGFPLLIEAFARISRKYPFAVLRIAGDGDQRLLAEATARNKGVHEKVLFLGFLTHDRVLSEMASAHVFALVGWDEPFGVVFAEALAAGKPIICATDCGITDVVRSGVHGLTVPPGDVAAAADALDTLLGDEAGRMRMGIAARQLFENELTWRKNASHMYSIFNSALLTARVADV